MVGRGRRSRQAVSEDRPTPKAASKFEPYNRSKRGIPLSPPNPH